LRYEDLFFHSIEELKLIERGHEIDIKDTWEMMRSHAILTISPHVKKGSDLTPSKIWPLSWEKVKKNTNLDIEKLRAKTEHIKNLFKKHQDGKRANS